MADKIKLSSISKGIESNELYLDVEFLENESVEELVLSVEDEPQQESEELEIEEPELQVHFLNSNLEEVVENSRVYGTDNIYIKEKKYILPIENLDDSTYEVDEPIQEEAEEEAEEQEQEEEQEP